MTIYKDKRNGKLIEVLDGTVMPASFELVKGEAPKRREWKEVKKNPTMPKPPKKANRKRVKKNKSKQKGEQ